MDKRTAQALIAPRWPPRDVASTAALRQAGIDDRLLTGAVRVGVIVRLRRGAYIPLHRWTSLKPWEKDAARVDAHIEGTGGSAVYCLSTAAILHGLSVWNVGPEVHVAVGYAGSGTSRGADSLSHRLELATEDVVVVVRRGRRLRATSMARTIADCARQLPYEEAVVIGDSALHRGVPRVDIVRAVAAGSARGRRRASKVLDALESATESPGESRVRVLVERLGFEKPVVQLVLSTPEGEYRADFAWPELMIIIEFDGEGKYMDYEPTPAVLLAERRREALLMEQGWIFIRLRWSDLERPDDVRRRIEAAMDRARRRTA
ncbi:type IV toxin-antitoxin system AbiEi family antitoxin domain-containing protein [Sinomonas sp. ASV486]|uniref:type IV toxin-antitoxin system AbiEi family antitoxin domain-containing protein n=1 Tax=Sinomonas sp. ASV486 TaxID=3051170 RepID=UPI0027DD2682|nr:type IV toxin-antitoxin system AbiEi family antitoxin domain-containing protein [Sinomonas sp. ASV486]MDQ4488705.1 type IV toxin-antitoxin system AbiEi family antitoxin domain-containing protein [Sinomonas sp. ASV486]